MVRVVALRWQFFWSEDWMWSVLDVFIVVTSLWEVAVDIISMVYQENGGIDSISGLTNMKSFRIIRLTRLLKTVQFVRIFRFVMALRMLVTSIISTLKALFWALILLGLIVYAPAPAPETLEKEGGFTCSLVSEAEGAEGYRWGCELGGGGDTFRQVFCQSAIESAQNDHAMVVQSMMDNKNAHLTKIKALFSEIGAEESGVLTIGVFEEKIKTPAVRQYFEALGLDVWDAWSFFKLLDVDGGGAVEIEEFFLGCLKFRGAARSMDVGKILQDQKWIINNQGHGVEHRALSSLSIPIYSRYLSYRVLLALF
ncbi:NaCP60E [Symbiodinium sp. CCMP2456]|nr:NaCP60E [Symbiodinium sp. CCMP2456]